MMKRKFVALVSGNTEEGYLNQLISRRTQNRKIQYFKNVNDIFIFEPILYKNNFTHEINQAYGLIDSGFAEGIVIANPKYFTREEIELIYAVCKEACGKLLVTNE